MNRTKLKTYAPQARRDFIQAMTDRAAYYGLSANKIEPVVERGDVAVIGGREFPIAVAKKRKRLVERIKLDGFEQTMESLAYTWFNRFVAIRYMELHGYLDHGYRVLSARNSTTDNTESTDGKRNPSSSSSVNSVLSVVTLPEILQHAEHVDLPGLKRETVIDLKLAGNKDAELYRLLLTAQCNALNRAMPFLFERIDDEAELLLPDNLLNSDSLIRSLVSNLDAEDCESVEVLGWLYQFYIAERKDQVMARKSAVPTEDIPAVTQLFTPHWIVRYLVENSLGRLWLLNRPGSRLREHMPYYIEDSDQRSVASGQKESNANPNLQRSDSLAEGDGSRGANTQAHEEFPERGTLRPDKPASTGSGIGAIEHRGGASSPIHSRVQELPFDSPGISGGSGNPTTSGHPLRVSDSAAGIVGPRTSGGNQQDAVESPKQAALVASDQWPVISKNIAGTATPTDHCPLITDHLRISSPEEIRLCDPACGSGHMLTYAFDLLTLIYEEAGYAPTEIPALILLHNLHGLEICPRAAQLAELALVFKAREKSRRFFQPEHLVRPHIIELQNVRFEENELPEEWLVASDQWPEGKVPAKADILHDLHLFTDAKNFGSLLQPSLTERQLSFLKQRVTDHWPLTTDHLFSSKVREHVLRVLEQAEALTQRYHVVVANPPYMGSSAMNSTLKQFIEKQLKDGKADTYTAFILRNLSLVMKGGVVGMITLPNWMFIQTFESLRDRLLNETHIASLVHCGRGVWGSDFGSCAFVLQSGTAAEKPGRFRRLFERSGWVQTNDQIESNFFDRTKFPDCVATAEDFRRIPGHPFVYWASNAIRNLFSKYSDIATALDTREGLATADNDRFLRNWSEVESAKTLLGCDSLITAQKSDFKWFPYVKGGEFRKWYGNNELVVNWQDDGAEVRQNFDSKTGRLRSHNYNGDYAFRTGLTWSGLSNGGFSVRYVTQGFKFDAKGPMGFAENGKSIPYLMGFLNSSISQTLLEMLAPTMDFKIGQILKLPLSEDRTLHQQIEPRVTSCIAFARADWDNFETSWDFRDQPLLRPGLKGATLEASWRNWKAQSTAAIRRMQELETENNRLFIAAYGLDGELEPEVPEAQITLARPDARRDMAAFLSYAVGCMMGRYGLEHPGLVFANSGNENFWDIYHEKHEKHERDKDGNFSCNSCISWSTYPPDEDGIIPVLDGDWFEDDIVARAKEFLRVTFGDESLNTNIQFIEQSLGKELRKYFLTDFYKDHLQTYKKRPIYWLFSSGKQRAFQCLVYLHRYTEGTLARMRTEYAIPLQGRMASRIEQLDGDKLKATSTSHRNKLQKEQDDLKKKQAELLTFEEKLKHAADQKITLDLDDGVKVNYANFGDLLAESKAICGTKDED